MLKYEGFQIGDVVADVRSKEFLRGSRDSALLYLVDSVDGDGLRLVELDERTLEAVEQSRTPSRYKPPFWEASKESVAVWRAAPCLTESGHTERCGPDVQSIPREPAPAAPGITIHNNLAWPGPAAPAPAAPSVENPKTAVGRQKAALALVSPVACALEAEAMMDGADKYGEGNYLLSPVPMMTYLHAAKRHIDKLIAGEVFAKDSRATHVGHARACLGIIAEAEAAGTLVDDRPRPTRLDDVHTSIHARRLGRIDGQPFEGADAACTFIGLPKQEK